MSLFGPRRSYRSIVSEVLEENLVPMSETDDFAQWAFGDGYSTAPLSQLDNRWNERHGDIVFVNGHDELKAGTQKMVAAWIKHGRVQTA